MYLIRHVRSSSRAVRFGCLCVLIALCWAMFGPSGSDAKLAPETPVQSWSSTSPAEEEIFIVYRDASGRYVCRAANKLERERINRRSVGGPTIRIYDGAPRDDGKSGALNSMSDSTVPLALQPSAGLRIVLNGTTQLNANQQAKNA